MKLTKLIFDYWKTLIRQPKEFCSNVEGIYFPSHSEYPQVQFWWILNASWYKMNNKSLSYTWAENPKFYVPFICPKDLEEIL
jgi:hypothetical protein